MVEWLIRTGRDQMYRQTYEGRSHGRLQEEGIWLAVEDAVPCKDKKKPHRMTSLPDRPSEVCPKYLLGIHVRETAMKHHAAVFSPNDNSQYRSDSSTAPPRRSATVAATNSNSMPNENIRITGIYDLIPLFGGYLFPNSVIRLNDFKTIRQLAVSEIKTGRKVASRTRSGAEVENETGVEIENKAWDRYQNQKPDWNRNKKSYVPLSSLKFKNKTGVENECRDGIRMKSVTGIKNESDPDLKLISIDTKDERIHLYVHAGGAAGNNHMERHTQEGQNNLCRII
ncbi:hypothetical protein EVAR_51833_1 [Eumeta japonica]|uniref:Uncharacterized protein n=1 Tax=Eumeta variegata TaxID=151549 RepID=A0A4C2A210_EUMVA|nr:hypothetical protein EVAR_51833_1 [Eumeta japonica]